MIDKKQEKHKMIIKKIKKQKNLLEFIEHI